MWVSDMTINSGTTGGFEIWKAFIHWLWKWVRKHDHHYMNYIYLYFCLRCYLLGHRVFAVHYVTWKWTEWPACLSLLLYVFQEYLLKHSKHFQPLILHHFQSDYRHLLGTVLMETLPFSNYRNSPPAAYETRSKHGPTFGYTSTECLAGIYTRDATIHSTHNATRYKKF